MRAVATLQASWFLIALLGASVARAQEEPPPPAKPLKEIPLEDLFDVQVVSPTHEVQRVAAAPAIIYAIRGEELRRSGVLTLAEALDRLPGITMVRLPDGTQQPVVRGALSPDGVLVMIDGVPVNDDLDGAFNFYGLDLADVDRVEVITGPGSALYGGRALFALVQIFTVPRVADDAPDRSYGVGVGGGTLGHRRGRLFFRQKYKDLRFHLSGAYGASLGSAAAIDSDFATLETTRRVFAAPPIGYAPLAPTTRQEPTEQGYFTAGFTVRDLEVTGFFASRRMLPSYTTFATVTPQDAYERNDLLGAAQASYRVQVTKAFALKPRLFFSVNRVRTAGTLTGPVVLNRDNDLDGINETWPSGWQEERRHRSWILGGELEGEVRPIESNTVTLGSSYEDRRLRSVYDASNIFQSQQQVGQVALPIAQIQTGQRFVDPSLSRTIFSLYAQDMQQISHYASLTGGMRWDHYSDFGNTVNPRGGVWVGPVEGLDFKVLVGRAFKPPTFLGLGDLTPTDRNPNRQFGNSNLQPTTVTTWEWAVSAHKGDFGVVGTAFHSDTRQEVVLDSNSQQFVNGPERSINGFSLEARFVTSLTRLVAVNYTYQSVSGLDTGFLAPLYPKHRFNAEAGWDIDKRFEVRAALRLRGAAHREPGDPRPDIGTQATVDLTLAAPEVVPHLRLETRFLNVTNQRWRDPAPLATGISDFHHDGFGFLMLAEVTEGS